jgi:hypothetical protein
MNPCLSTESSSNSSSISQNIPFNVKEDIIKQILEEKCFYKKLGIRKTAQPCDIRRAYLQKSKVFLQSFILNCDKEMPS